MKLIKGVFAIALTAVVLGNISPVFASTALPPQLIRDDSPKVAAAVSTATPLPASAPPKLVTIQPGDYLEKVAIDNQTTSLRLFYANPDIANPDLIFPDQQLRIPAPTETLTAREVPVNQQIAVPTPAQSTQAAASNYAPSDGSVWDSIAACESGGNWAINTGNGFYGGLQFTLSSWQGVGGSGYPSDASREEQIARGQALQSRSGWGAWPACSAKLGL